MREWTIYKKGLYERVRLRVAVAQRVFGLGIVHERYSTGTTYREPGTNESRSFFINLGRTSIHLLHTWKDVTKNRLDDIESPIYVQTYGRGYKG